MRQMSQVVNRERIDIIVHALETNRAVQRRSITVEEIVQVEDMAMTAQGEEIDHQAVSTQASTAVTSTAAAHQATVARVKTIEEGEESRQEEPSNQQEGMGQD